MIRSREVEGSGEYREKTSTSQTSFLKPSCLPQKKKLIAIIGYFRTFKEYLQKSQIWQSETKSQPGNSQPSSLVRTCLPLPNLGFLWVFFKYPIFSCVRDNFKFFFATQEKTLGFSAHGPQQKVNCIQTPGETKNNLYFFLK